MKFGWNLLVGCFPVSTASFTHVVYKITDGVHISAEIQLLHYIAKHLLIAIIWEFLSFSRIKFLPPCAMMAMRIPGISANNLLIISFSLVLTSCKTLDMEPVVSKLNTSSILVWPPWMREVTTSESTCTSENFQTEYSYIMFLLASTCSGVAVGLSVRWGFLQS